VIKLNLQTRVITSIGEIHFENKFDVSHVPYELPKAADKATAYGFLDSKPEPWAL
jgi:hypothetical protein